MIYLDNSATTWPKPQSVISAVVDGMTKFGANPGRSGHSQSVKTAEKVAQVRMELADFVGAEGPESVIFTGGCTEALNLAILGSAQKGGHVICTTNDHNSILRPVEHIKELGVDVSFAAPQGDNGICLDDLLPHVKPNTYMICLSHVCNVNGAEADIEKIGRFCQQKCILFLLDGAQGVGHKPINMLKNHIDFLAVAGHKGLYGPMGAGALVISGRASLKPIKFGGTGTASESLVQPTDVPEGFESGTLPVPAILGLGAGLEFVKKNFVQIQEKIDDLTTYMNYHLRQISGVRVYTEPTCANGVIGFNVGEVASSEVASELDERFGIMVRSGLHCAPLWHKSHGTLESGAVRASISYFTKFSEVEKFLRAIRVIARE